MSELTHTPAFALRAESAADFASQAPSHPELMRELGVKPKPGWTARLPPGLASFVTNGKGMTGVIILAVLILMSAFARSGGDRRHHSCTSEDSAESVAIIPGHRDRAEVCAVMEQWKTSRSTTAGAGRSYRARIAW